MYIISIKARSKSAVHRGITIHNFILRPWTFKVEDTKWTFDRAKRKLDAWLGSPACRRFSLSRKLCSPDRGNSFSRRSIHEPPRCRHLDGSQQWIATLSLLTFYLEPCHSSTPGPRWFPIRMRVTKFRGLPRVFSLLCLWFFLRSWLGSLSSVLESMILLWITVDTFNWQLEIGKIIAWPLKFLKKFFHF